MVNNYNKVHFNKTDNTNSNVFKINIEIYYYDIDSDIELDTELEYISNNYDSSKYYINNKYLKMQPDNFDSIDYTFNNKYIKSKSNVSTRNYIKYPYNNIKSRLPRKRHNSFYYNTTVYNEVSCFSKYINKVKEYLTLIC